MSQIEQQALITFGICAGLVILTHACAYIYLNRGTEKKAKSQQEPKGKDPAHPDKATIDLISSKTAKERKKRQKLYL